MSDWTIKNFTYGSTTKSTVFHAHGDFLVFIIWKNNCPLCKEQMPAFISLQISLIENKGWENGYPIFFVEKNDFSQKGLIQYKPYQGQIEAANKRSMNIDKVKELLGKYRFRCI